MSYVFSAKWGALCAAAATLWGFIVPALAAPTTFDATFGNGGKFSYSISSSVDIPYASALQPDGKIVVAGYCYTSLYAVCVSRINANGSLDGTFGAVGTFVGTVGTNTTTNASVAVLPDGKILFGGQCAVSGQIDFCLLRLSSNGALDSTFGAGGVTTTNFSGTSDDLIFGITALPGGTIIASGRCNGGIGYRFCMARYLSNGTLDTSFGSAASGLVTQSLSGTGESRGRAVVIQSDGKLLFAGNCDYSGVTRFCSARYTPNGFLDSSYGSSGIFQTQLTGSSDIGIAIALQADSKIVFVGVCGSDFCATRYLANGAVDTTFGSAGVVVVNFASAGATSAFARAVVIQGDGKIVIAGACQISGVGQNCLVRLNADGSPDLSFTATGKVNFAVDPLGDESNSLLIQLDGKIIVSGQCGDLRGATLNVCLARLEGGPLSGRACSQDIDGDGVFRATTDALILTRIALGMTGSALVNGINFPLSAKRTTWTDIRAFLVSQCGLALPL